VLHALILKARSMEDTINGIIRSSLATPGPYGGPSWEPEMGEAEHALMCHARGGGDGDGDSESQTLVAISRRFLTKLGALGRAVGGAIVMVYYRRGEQYDGPNWRQEREAVELHLQVRWVCVCVALCCVVLCVASFNCRRPPSPLRTTHALASGSAGGERGACKHARISRARAPTASLCCFVCCAGVRDRACTGALPLIPPRAVPYKGWRTRPVTRATHLGAAVRVRSAERTIP
jgi:hypothetical protein